MHKRMPLPARYCEVCGALLRGGRKYRRVRKDKRYCSERCTVAAWRARRRENGLTSQGGGV